MAMGGHDEAREPHAVPKSVISIDIQINVK